MTQRQLGILLLLATVLLWGPAPVITKLALLEIPQWSLGFFRFVISTLIMAFLFLPKGYFRIAKGDLGLFIAAGLSGSVINSLFFLYGIQRTSAISAQAIFTATPVLTAFLSYFILKEKIKSIQMGGVFIGLIGALLVATQDVFARGSLNGGSMLGNSFMFLAAVSWVAYIFISKRLLARYSPITVTSISFVVGLIAFIPLVIFENLTSFSWIYSLGFNGILGVIYQGIFASVLAILAYQTGLKLTSAFAAGVILYLNPVATTLFAVPILGEKITTPFLIGTSLILFGSFLATQLEAVKNHVKRRLRK